MRALLILAIDTTTLSCSVALLQEDTILAEMSLNIHKTHSERLMPLLDQMLTESGIEREEIEAVAAAAGPGSFTGLRIGVSTARALAQALNIPAVPVCTLEALADSVPTPDALICPLLDARRNQIYTAIYKRQLKKPFKLETLLAPTAIDLNELIESLQSFDQPVTFIGEGLHSYDQVLAEALPSARISPAPFRLCRASLVALRARILLQDKPDASYLELLPVYLRRPEAERKAEENKQGGAR